MRLHQLQEKSWGINIIMRKIRWQKAEVAGCKVGDDYRYGKTTASVIRDMCIVSRGKKSDLLPCCLCTSGLTLGAHMQCHVEGFVQLTLTQSLENSL